MRQVTVAAIQAAPALTRRLAAAPLGDGGTAVRHGDQATGTGS